MGTVKTELMNDGNVTLVDFGTFKILERSAHRGRNPQIREELQIILNRA